MKKFNYLLLGLAGLAMASCSQDDLVGPANGDGNFNITVNLPADLATRAFGNGLTADNLQIAVYEVVNNETQTTPAFTDKATFNGALSTTVSLNLINGKSYSIAFFAQSQASIDNKVYNFNANEGTMTVEYKNMGNGATTDAYDCFYALYTTGVISNTNLTHSVTLTRPVAQINWGANDIDANDDVTAVFGENGQYVVSNVTISEAYNTLNLFTGDVMTDKVEDVEITGMAIPATSEAFPVSPSEYQYVAMQYVLAPKSENVYDLTLNVDNSGNPEATKYENEVIVSAAPVQANYRTNIYGALLTATTDFEVTKNNVWSASYEINVAPDGAWVEMTTDGTVNCLKPALPKGVTPENFEENEMGGVYIDASGNPVYFAPTNKGIQEAIDNGATEIYFAPNSEINNSNRFTVPEGNLTIHGNGATLYGSNFEIALATSYPDDSTINLNISNLNNGKVWGAPKGAFTMNLTMTNCTMTSTGNSNGAISFTNLSNDYPDATINMTFENCHAQETQLGVYTNYPGTIIGKDCVFNNVGLPYNINNKSTTILANVTVSGNNFNTCGISQDDTSNGAWNYAAPVRVISGGAANMVNLLVDNCVFENTLSPWDILLMDYRETKKWFPFTYTIQNCIPSNPTVRAN